MYLNSLERTKRMLFIFTITQPDILSGILECPYLKNKVEFQSLGELILLMNEVMQDVNIPKASDKTYIYHSQIFHDIKNHTLLNYFKNESWHDLKRERFFYVEVFYRQNYTWQGKVVSYCNQEDFYFKSVLELLERIYSVCHDCL